MFVYGSLMRGQVNHHVMGTSVFIGPDKTTPTYTLYDLGPYPGLRPEGTHAVHGECYRVTPEQLHLLDRFEECPDEYQRAATVLASGRRAQVYLVSPALAQGKPRVASGHWGQRCGANATPAAHQG